EHGPRAHGLPRPDGPFAVPARRRSRPHGRRADAARRAVLLLLPDLRLRLLRLRRDAVQDRVRGRLLVGGALPSGPGALPADHRDLERDVLLHALDDDVGLRVLREDLHELRELLLDDLARTGIEAHTTRHEFDVHSCSSTTVVSSTTASSAPSA